MVCCIDTQDWQDVVATISHQVFMMDAAGEHEGDWVKLTSSSQRQTTCGACIRCLRFFGFSSIGGV